MKKLILFSLLFCNTVFADEMPMAPRDQSLWQTLIMILVALTFFYFILWRPEQKRRKIIEDQRSSLKKGDKVVAMGIIGIVQKVQENTVIVKMVDGSKIEFLKGAITDVTSGGEEESGKEE